MHSKDILIVFCMVGISWTFITHAESDDNALRVAQFTERIEEDIQGLIGKRPVPADMVVIIDHIRNGEIEQAKDALRALIPNDEFAPTVGISYEQAATVVQPLIELVSTMKIVESRPDLIEIADILIGVQIGHLGGIWIIEDPELCRILSFRSQEKKQTNIHFILRNSFYDRFYQQYVAFRINRHSRGAELPSESEFQDVVCLEYEDAIHQGNKPEDLGLILGENKKFHLIDDRGMQFGAVAMLRAFCEKNNENNIYYIGANPPAWIIAKSAPFGLALKYDQGMHGYISESIQSDDELVWRDLTNAAQNIIGRFPQSMVECRAAVIGAYCFRGTLEQSEGMLNALLEYDLDCPAIIYWKSRAYLRNDRFKDARELAVICEKKFPILKKQCELSQRRIEAEEELYEREKILKSKIISNAVSDSEIEQLLNIYFVRNKVPEWEVLQQQRQNIGE